MNRDETTRPSSTCSTSGATINNYNFGQRRVSFTERVIGNARDWFQRSNSRDSTGAPFASSSESSSIDIGAEGGRGRPRSLSTSYMFNHHRDLIIPGPVF